MSARPLKISATAIAFLSWLMGKPTRCIKSVSISMKIVASFRQTPLRIVGNFSRHHFPIRRKHRLVWARDAPPCAKAPPLKNNGIISIVFFQSLRKGKSRIQRDELIIIDHKAPIVFRTMFPRNARQQVPQIKSMRILRRILFEPPRFLQFVGKQTVGQRNTAYLRVFIGYRAMRVAVNILKNKNMIDSKRQVILDPLF